MRNEGSDMLKRVLGGLVMLALLMAGAWCAAAQTPAADLDLLARVMVLDEYETIIAPQEDGSLRVQLLDPEGTLDEHVTFLQGLDWRTVASYDPQTETLIWQDGTAINAAYPWRKWSNVRKLVDLDAQVFLTADGCLFSTAEGIAVPDWTNLVDAGYLQGDTFDEATEEYMPWNGFVGLTAQGNVLASGLPDNMTRTMTSWKNVRRLYPMSGGMIAMDEKGHVLVAAEDAAAQARVADIFAGLDIRKLICFDDYIFLLLKDGTFVAPAGLYEEIYGMDGLAPLFIDGNYDGAAQWTDLADVILFNIPMREARDEVIYGTNRMVAIGLTQDGVLLMDGLRNAAPEVAAFFDQLGTTLDHVTDGDLPLAEYRPDAYVRRAAFRSGMAFSGEYAAVIDADKTLFGAGKINASSVANAPAEWKNLVSVAGSNSHLVGLKADGTAVAMGLNSRRQCDLNSWWNITQIAAGDLFTVGLTEYGLVAYAGTAEKTARLAKYWKDVLAIDACDDHVVGLRLDGTALSTVADAGEGCMEMRDWTHLVDIAAGSENRAAGILVDGTLVATQNVYNENPEAFVNLNDIVFSGSVLYGLRADGTVAASTDAAQQKVADWQNIIAIAGSGSAILGQTADGTLLWQDQDDRVDGDVVERLTAWNAPDGYSDVKPFFYDFDAVYDLMDDLALQLQTAPIAAGDDFVVAIRRDGSLYASANAPASLINAEVTDIASVAARGDRVLVTFRDGRIVLYSDQGAETLEGAGLAVLGDAHVLTIHPDGGEWDNGIHASGDNAYGQCNLQGVYAATNIAAGDQHSVAVIGNAYLTAEGDNSYGQCNVDDWHHVVQLAAGARHTLGLTQDGRVLATGDNAHGQCQVSGWEGRVKMLAAGDRFSAGMTADGHVLLAGDVHAALQQALAWERIVFIASSGEGLVGVDSSGVLYSTHVDVGEAGLVSLNSIELPDSLLPVLSLPMQYNTLAAGNYGVVALCEDGTVLRNEIRYNPYYDSAEELGDYYADYAIAAPLPLADKPVAMVCAVRGGAVLYEDGTVYADPFFSAAAQWTDIVMISGNRDMLGALTREGKVLLSGAVSENVAAQVAAWKPVVYLDVQEDKVGAITMDGNRISAQPRISGDSTVLYNLVALYDGIGVYADGTTTYGVAEDKKVIDAALGSMSGVLLFEDGTASIEVPGVTLPIVQVDECWDTFILQQQDGTIFFSGGVSERLSGVHEWKIALPRGVEKIVVEAAVLPEGVSGTADFRPYSRVCIDDDMLVVLSDGYVLRKSADQWEYDRYGRPVQLLETRQELLDEDFWYDIVEIVRGVGLRKDGLVVVQDFRGNSSIREGWQNIRKLVLNGVGGIREDGTFISIYDDERSRAASAWTELVDVHYVGNGIAGLRSDGTVVSYGLSDAMAETLARWRNIEEITAYEVDRVGHLAGLTTEGEVLLSSAVPGDPPAVTRPAKHIKAADGEPIVIYEDGTVEPVDFCWISFREFGGDIVDVVADSYLAVGIKTDGSLVYSVTGDWAKDGFYPNYDEWSISSINIDTLEGVIVKPASREEPAAAAAAAGIAAVQPHDRVNLINGVSIILEDSRVLRLGTVYEWNAETGKREKTDKMQQILDESVWYDIVQLDSFFGLRSDGTVVIPENDSIYDHYPDLPEWNDVIKLRDYGYGLIHADGSYSRISGNAAGAEGWTDVVDVYYIYDCGTVALKADGTLITDLLEPDLAWKVKDWRNIIEIAPYHDSYYGDGLVGLMADGSVLLSGGNGGNLAAGDKPVARLCGDGYRVYALYQDGTVGPLTRGCFSLDGFDNSDLVAFVHNGYCAIGVKSDGWLVYTVDEGSDAAWEYPDYTTYDIDSINIYTLEGVTVQ